MLKSKAAVKMPNFVYKVFDPKVDIIYAAHVNGLTVKDIAVREHADVAINLNYADDKKGVPIGRLVVDGKTVIYDIDKTTNRDELYMLPDRSLHIGKHPAPVWAMQGTPRLLENGKEVIDASVKRDRTLPDVANRPAIRSATGITATGKLVIVKTQDVATLKELAAIMLKLGCVEALNGDGGGSSYMYPIDNGWGRKIGAALIVKKGVAPVSKKKYVVDAGHGPETAGKRCPDDSMREFHFNSVVARCVRDGLLQYEDVEVKFSHADDGSRDVPLSERVKVANDWDADAFISIHANAASSVWSAAHGIETFTCDEPSAMSLKMAYAVQEKLIAATGLADRGVKQEDFYVIDKTTMPAILVENGFMSNMEEASLLKTDAYRRKCAGAIVEGIAEVFALKKKEVKPLDTKIIPVNVVINGKEIADGHIINGVTYAPVRAIAEELGVQIAWEQNTKTVTITK